MSIAMNIKRAMDENAVTTAALAAKSGVEAGFLRKYLSGKIKPSEAVLARLADGIGVPVETLSCDSAKRSAGKVRPEDAALRLKRSAQDIRIGLQLGLLPFGRAYKREGSSIFTYEIDPGRLEEYARDQEQFWTKINDKKEVKNDDTGS